jgi:hypothetical protein
MSWNAPICLSVRLGVEQAKHDAGLFARDEALRAGWNTGKCLGLSPPTIVSPEWNEPYRLENLMDTEKKPDEPSAEKPKQDVGQIVGDLVVSGATVLAHSAAEAVVKRVRKAAAKTRPVKAVGKAVKKARRSAPASKASKNKKAKKTSNQSSATKRAGRKATKKSATRATKKKSKR